MYSTYYTINLHRIHSLLCSQEFAELSINHNQCPEIHPFTMKNTDEILTQVEGFNLKMSRLLVYNNTKWHKP